MMTTASLIGSYGVSLDVLTTDRSVRSTVMICTPLVGLSTACTTTRGSSAGAVVPLISQPTIDAVSAATSTTTRAATRRRVGLTIPSSTRTTGGTAVGTRPSPEAG